MCLAADRPYVVDIHIPGAAADHCQLSPSHSGDRVVSPVGASGLQRSQTPIKASPVGLREDSAGIYNTKLLNKFQIYLLTHFYAECHLKCHAS